jgi:hypothetical protein
LVGVLVVLLILVEALVVNLRGAGQVVSQRVQMVGLMEVAPWVVPVVG